MAAVKSQAAPRFYARRGFTYAGTDLYRGQVFTLIGSVNDEKLVRLKYVNAVEPHHTVYTCAQCGAEFVEMEFRSAHGREAHRPRPEHVLDVDSPVDLREADKAADLREKRLNDEAPLALENTIASRR